VDGRRPHSWFCAEYDAAGATKRGQIDPEHVGVLDVIRVQGHASVQRWDRAQGPEQELTTSDDDLDPGPDREPRRIARVAGEPVPPTQVAPDLGAVRISVRIVSSRTPSIRLSRAEASGINHCIPRLASPSASTITRAR
jgi:hypothetical protein